VVALLVALEVAMVALEVALAVAMVALEVALAVAGLEPAGEQVTPGI
jgi:hypothetical protein